MTKNTASGHASRVPHLSYVCKNIYWICHETNQKLNETKSQTQFYKDFASGRLLLREPKGKGSSLGNEKRAEKESVCYVQYSNESMP